MADGETIVIGDPIGKVYKELGHPRMEFPLKGLFVQHYDTCIIKSRDGKIVEVLNTGGTAKPKDEEVVEEDKALSINHVRAMAENGDAESQYYMAYWSQTGQCVSKDMKEALAWYAKAALQGHMAAQHNLGVLYMNGDGVEKDLEQAYIWAVLAAENGNASLKKVLARSLSEEQKLSSTIRVDQIKISMLNAAANPDKEEPAPANGIVDTFTISK
ncbi:MAG: tetratricopeptide repeat protein [Pontiella sp.]